MQCPVDGAVLVMSEEAAARLGCRPRAHICSFAVAAVDPLIMLTAPIPAHAAAAAATSTRRTTRITAPPARRSRTHG